VKTSLFLLLLFLSHGLIAQHQDSASTYLVLRLPYKYDANKKHYFFTIQTDWGAPNAQEIYTLKDYANEKGATNNLACTYYNRTDTCTQYYNYFVNSSDALNFLARHGWSVISVYAEILSDYTYERGPDGSMPITTVSSKPVYLIRKTLTPIP
jgi:hypothetical protein